MLTSGEIIRCDFSPWPNISRWLKNVKALPSWNKVNEPFYSKLVKADAGTPRSPWF